MKLSGNGGLIIQSGKQSGERGKSLSALFPALLIEFIQLHPQVFQNTPVGTEKRDGNANE